MRRLLNPREVQELQRLQGEEISLEEAELDLPFRPRPLPRRRRAGRFPNAHRAFLAVKLGAMVDQPRSVRESLALGNRTAWHPLRKGFTSPRARVQWPHAWIGRPLPGPRPDRQNRRVFDRRRRHAPRGDRRTAQGHWVRELVLAAHGSRSGAADHSALRSRVLHHIFPRGLFNRPVPPDVLTAPACEGCQQTLQPDEEYFRTFAAAGAYQDASARELWEGRITRSFDNSPGLR